MTIKYIKILSREKYFFNKFKIQNFEIMKINFKIHFISGLPKYILEFFFFCFNIINFVNFIKK